MSNGESNEEFSGAYPVEKYTIKGNQEEPKRPAIGLPETAAEEVRKQENSKITFAMKLAHLNRDYEKGAQRILNHTTELNEREREEAEKYAKIEQERKEKIEREKAEKRKQELDTFVEDLSSYLSDPSRSTLPIGMIRPSKEKKELEIEYKVSEENIVPALEILGAKLKFQEDGSVKAGVYDTDVLGVIINVYEDSVEFNKKKSDTLFVILYKRG